MPDKETNPNLVVCKHCGEFIARTAKTCPHCGGKNKAKKSKAPIIVGGIILLAILILFAYYSDPFSSYDDTPLSDYYTMSEEEYKNSCQEISSDTLTRESENRIGEKVKITGKVFQVVYDEGEYYSQYLVSTKLEDYYSFSEYMGGNIYVEYDRGDNPKILEDDVITIYGEIKEDYTYETVSGASQTVPQITGYYIELKK